jgi:hypothetical protein
MRIRHLVGSDNVDKQGFVIDPLLARHGLVAGGRVAALAGLIEASTHLSLDFSAHRLDACLVVERLEIGAAVLWDGEQFRVAAVRTAAYRHLGPIDVDARRAAWQQTVRTQKAAL